MVTLANQFCHNVIITFAILTVVCKHYILWILIRAGDNEAWIRIEEDLIR